MESPIDRVCVSLLAKYQLLPPQRTTRIELWNTLCGWAFCLLPHHFLLSLLSLVLTLLLAAHPTVAQQRGEPLAVELTPVEQAYIQANPVIRVHAESDWPPYNFVKNGNPTGFSNEYIRLIAQKVGLEVEFVVGPTWNEFMTMLAQKEIDVITNMVITPERQQFTIYSEEYVFDLVNSLLTRTDGEDYTDLEQLKGKNLAIVRGFFFEEILTKYYPEINLLFTNNTLDAMKQVQGRRADAALESDATFNYYIDRYFLTDLVSRPLIGNLHLSNAGQYLGIRKDRPILKSILDKAMAAVSEEDYANLRRRWYLASETAGFGFTKRELEYLQNKREIKMCVDPSWMPLEGIINGQHTGMSADFFELLRARIGIPIKLRSTQTWVESIEEFQQRRCDILSLAVATPERREYADFTRPYLELPLVIATREREPFIPDIRDVINKKIGMVKNYAFVEILQEQYPDMQIIEVASIEDGLRQVEQGNLFGYVDVLPTTSYAIQKRFPSLKIAGRFDKLWPLGVAVRNDEPELLSIFDKAIASIDERTTQSIINAWISVRYEQGFDYRILRRFLLIALGILAIVIYRQYLLQTYNRKLEKISITDPLTGCYNRLKIEKCLLEAEFLFHRHQRRFSIILCDIDYFKKINDTFGHLVGDAVLKEMAVLLNEGIRNTDILGRWGGEEFMIIMPNTDLSGAMALAEALRQHFAEHKFTTVGHQTASFGVAEFDHSNFSISHLISQVDEALYKAKERGRNCAIASEKMETL
ncbi:MAG: diguanylate cyclase [Arthrospira sp. PLM2.Bin9]|nr:transporter substrate-binding domain-containing protein [Arthrospira sp. PLM2.Bin9]TVU53825.1 MAG: diguanylate cyclase [Arthrospira sp. PLM2.Bin9]